MTEDTKIWDEREISGTVCGPNAVPGPFFITHVLNVVIAALYSIAIYIAYERKYK
mgnify:CR=1 FL=1